MSKLQMKLKAVIDDSDWDAFVGDVYGKVYCFQQQDDCRDRGSYSFEVPNKYDIDKYERDSIPVEVNGEVMGVSLDAWVKRTEPFFKNISDECLFWERNFYPSLEEVAEDLYNKGLIEAGEYTIEVDW